MKCRISNTDKEYLPLYYGKTSLILDSSNINFDEEILEHVIETEDNELGEKFRKTHRGQKIANKYGKGIVKEFFRAYSVVRKWMYDKQVYTLSKEMEEVVLQREESKVETETLTNAWEFLPTRSFCLNFGEDSKIAKELKASCIFVYIYKQDEVWVCSAVRFSKHVTAEGVDFYFGPPDEMEKIKYELDKDKNKYSDETNEACVRIRTVLYAVLNYLSNDYAEIEETKESKKNYQEREKGSPLKNDISEVQEYILSPRKAPEDFMMLPENGENPMSMVGKWAAEFQSASSAFHKVKFAE